MSKGWDTMTEDEKNQAVGRVLGHCPTLHASSRGAPGPRYVPTPLETLAHDADDSIAFWAAMGANDRMCGAKLDDARGGLDVADFADENDPEGAYTMALASWRAGWKIADTIARDAQRRLDEDFAERDERRGIP